MPHVDEGTLHALLDGALRADDPARADAVEAHVETCADCHALLEQAAALRGRSAEVLGLLEPGVVPDFEEVLVRAGASASDRRGLARQARRTRGLAWAATIVIALGTGYLIRDRLAPERAAMTRSAEDAAVTSVEPAAGAGPDITEPAEAAAPTDADTDLAPPASGDAAAPPPPQSTSRVASPDPVPAVEEPEVREEASERVAEPPRQVELADGAAPRRADAPTPAPDPFPMSEEVALDAIVVTGVAEGDPADEADVAESGPRVVSAAEAGDILGAPLLVLPGAELGEITAAEDADGPVVVSLQRVRDGAEIRVTQRTPGEPLGMPVDRIEAPSRFLRAGESSGLRRATGQQAVNEAEKGPAMAAAAEVNTVVVRVDTAELILEGPLPERVLRLLAAGARPLEPQP